MIDVTCCLHSAINNCYQQREYTDQEAAKQRQVDDLRDKKTGLEQKIELKTDIQCKRQAELTNIKVGLQQLEGSSDRLQELEQELNKAVRQQWDSPNELLFDHYLTSVYIQTLPNLQKGYVPRTRA